jgi:ATP-dependent Lon protease
VILPERNRKDVIEIPEQPRKEIEILYIKRMDELLSLALTEMPKLGVMPVTTSTPPPPPPPAAA